MRQTTRRAVLGSTVWAASLFAGCSENSPSGSFTQTAVDEQQLIVEFEESIGAETISVVDPEGEPFADASLSAGVSHVTFDIEIPYTPGEHQIVATDGDETVAETTQEIRPELEIVDVGVGANRLDEMPEELGHTKADEAFLEVRNAGNGPEEVSGLQFLGDLPNPGEIEGNQTGIFEPESGGDAHGLIPLRSGETQTLFSSTLPFSFEGDGVDCSDESIRGEMSVELRGEVAGWITKEYSVEYSAADSYDSCDISLQEGE